MSDAGSTGGWAPPPDPYGPGQPSPGQPFPGQAPYPGQPFPGQPPYGGPGAPGGQLQHPPAAIVSLIAGILGLLMVLPVVGSVVALVAGFMSKSVVQREPYRYTDTLGRAGRILGWIGIGLTVLGILAVILIFIVFAGAGTSSYWG